MRWHLEAAQFKQTQSTPFTVGAEEFVHTELGAMGIAGDVHQQVAQQTVHQPRRWILAEALQFAEGDLELVQTLAPSLVYSRRLTGGTDETPGKQIRQRRVVLPKGEHAAQQVRTS